MSSRGEAEINITTRGRWVRVHADVDGEDVSRLSYAPQPVGVGPAGEISMAGIGGVGTDPEYRQLGLAHRVYQRAMEEIRAAGYGSVGLYTGTGIIAHRLYRRFGFVDTHLLTNGLKLLRPAEYVTHRLSALLQDEGLATWRCTLRVELPPHDPVYVRVRSGTVELLEAAPEEVDLSLTMTSGAFVRLFEGRVDVAVADASGEVQWHGAREHWETLRRALAARRPVTPEGSP